KEFFLTIRYAGPAAREKISVELLLDRLYRDSAVLSAFGLLNEYVKDLTADELDEVGIATRLVNDELHRVRAELDRTVGCLDRPENRFPALVGAEFVQSDHTEHPLCIGSGIDELWEQRRQSREHEHEGNPLLLDRLEHVEQDRERKLFLACVVGEILRLVIGEDDPLPAVGLKVIPRELQGRLDLVGDQAPSLVVDILQDTMG